MNALNIVIRQDIFTEENDPNSEGTNITAEQAAEIRKRVVNVKRDLKKFLEWAGAETFETIQTGRLDEIEAFLAKSERLAIQNLGR